MIKNLKNLFSNNKHQPHHHRHRSDKENDAPLLMTDAAPHGGGHRRMEYAVPRRVNFRASSQKRGGFEPDVESDDGGSEVTLTTTANSEARQHYQQHNHRQLQQQPVNPYSVWTEPKRIRGPRSCPGGGGGVGSRHAPHLLDIDEELSSGNPNNNSDNSSPLDTRSEFIPTQQRQHRRSSRRPPPPQALMAIDNGNSRPQRIMTRSVRRLSIDGGVLPSATVGRSSRYKNVSTIDANGGWADAEQQQLLEECEALRHAWQAERARRKDLQRKLREVCMQNEQLKLENTRLQMMMNFGMLTAARQQQTNFVPPAALTADLLGAPLFNGGGGGTAQTNTWTGSTPSSSNAMPTPSRQPQWPPFAAHFPQPLFHPQPLHHGAGESLAQMTSNVSLNQQQYRTHQHIMPPPVPPRELPIANGIVHDADDEVKVHRNGQRQQNTDSFSGGSRPNTEELRDATELQQLKDAWVGESSNGTNFSLTPESARGKSCHNGTFMLGLSMSADTIAACGPLIVDSPPPKDDGYMTSETNVSNIFVGPASTGTFVDGKGFGGILHRSKSLD